jgi:hypothetical protein
VNHGRYEYKFLRRGGVGPFSGIRWPENVWVSVTGPTRSCQRGVHACTVEDLPLWLNEELWVIELGEPIVRGPDKLVAAAGRLERRVDAWDETSALGFARDCTSRVTSRAVDALLSAGLAADGARIRETPEDELESALEPLAQRPGAARPACEYAAAAAASLRDVPFVAAAGAAYAASLTAARAGGPEEQRREREKQAAWLAHKLNLAHPRPAV